MLCLAGRNLFSDNEAPRVTPRGASANHYQRFTICPYCEALLWFNKPLDEGTLHLCYWLTTGRWRRACITPDVMLFAKHSLACVLGAVTGKSDPDMVMRYFRKDNLCRHYRGVVSNCAGLYQRFFRQRNHLDKTLRDSWETA